MYSDSGIANKGLHLFLDVLVNMLSLRHFCPAKVTTVEHAHKPELINIRPYEILDLMKH